MDGWRKGDEDEGGRKERGWNGGRDGGTETGMEGGMEGREGGMEGREGGMEGVSSVVEQATPTSHPGLLKHDTLLRIHSARQEARDHGPDVLAQYHRSLQ